MVILDQLRQGRYDRLRALAALMLAGLCLLVGRLWYLQILEAKHYRKDLRSQSYRTVRLPAVRGKIFDRNGIPMAINRPRFNIDLYLEDLRSLFQTTYSRNKRAYLAAHGTRHLSRKIREKLGRQSRYDVVSNLAFQANAPFQDCALPPEDLFRQHFRKELAMPLPLRRNLSFRQVALFAEKVRSLPGVELEIEPVRIYPNGTTAAHVLGFLRRDDQAGDSEDDDLSYNYRLPDYKGFTGVEAAYDMELRGKPGMKSMLVNNLGYRQQENLWIEPQPGKNIYLTIDLPLQRVAEKALSDAGPDIRGAVVVLDVRNGDVLVLASAPTFDPNAFQDGISSAEWKRLDDPEQRPLFNRATFGAYPPGSIFKIITGLACLEAGVLRPGDTIYNPGEFRFPNPHARPIHDLAPPGYYNFQKAFKRSSNTYFIHFALKAGIKNLLAMARQFHLGERTGIPTFQETGGILPTLRQVRRGWYPGDTANLSIGQGQLAVTPLQMAVMTAAIANGGTIFHPRLVSQLVPQAGLEDQTVTTVVPQGRLWSRLRVHPANLELIRRAMRADVTDGTGRAADVPGMEICGKTGTAEIKRGFIHVIKKITWFVSFASLQHPRYAVVVMIENGTWGGTTCAPVARRIYEAIEQRENRALPATVALNR